MPVTSGIGYSDETPRKQEGLDAVLRQHIAIVKRVLSKHQYFPQRYYYIDLYAGSGSNQEVNCKGSPVIFLETITGQMDYHGYFIEREPGNTIFLRAATSFTNNHDIYTGDNADIAPAIIDSIPKNAYGLIYADPNGIPNFELLAELANKRTHMDILIRYNANAAKRNSVSLMNGLEVIGKQRRIFQKPEGIWQWSFIFLTRYSDYKAWHRYNFWEDDSPQGLEILKKLVFTKDEINRLSQPDLLEDTPRAVAMRRSQGICERCHKNPVSEIHHLSYKQPETPDKLMAVCHPCHCKLSGTEN